MNLGAVDGRRKLGGGLAVGIGIVFESVGLLRRNASLWPLASVPVLFSLLFLTTGIGIFWNSFDSIQASWVSLLPVVEAGAWWTWLWVGPAQLLLWLVGWLGVLAILAVVMVGALLLAKLASAPFLDLLSQRVEAIEAGRAAEGASGLVGMAGETLRSFWAELRRLGFLGAMWITLTLAGFIVPGAHLITGPALVVLTILFLPLDYAGFSLDRRQVAFRDRRNWLRSQLGTVFGFGGTAFLGSLVPGVNLVLMPVLVTAGTLLVVRREPTQSDTTLRA